MIMIRRKGDGEDATTRFAPGDLVRHRRYGYRGVVVAVATGCAAPDEWYSSNQTQPRRDQPWYHVLVDRSLHTTYAAEENLLADHGGGEIMHPLIDEFFYSFQDGRYLRNDRPWGAS